MNREIKFKAWDVVFKEMFFVYQINWHKGKIIDIFGRNDDFSTKWLDPNLTILLEYTGRKDKNGKEIYFHDLVKAPSGNIFEVVWDEDSLSTKLLYKDTLYGFNVKLYELIGHIHEQG